MRVGIEVGGTFTDLVAIDDCGRILVAKVPSTPAAPDDGAVAALDAAGFDLSAVDDLVHGSTVATNAILERKGARVLLVVSAGLRDILFLQRHNRRHIYDLAYAKPVPVVQRRDVVEAPERIDASGAVVAPLDLTATIDRVASRLAAEPCGAIAVCLLNAYLNPTHEAAIARALRARWPALRVTASHEICREFREYERCSTTTLAAFVQPVIDAYLGRFDDALTARGYRGRFSVMQSNGGRLPAAGMRRSAITALFSGPAAGVVGALRQAARSQRHNLITFDMGGTSTDVCLVRDGRPDVTAQTEIHGLPVMTPVIDIATIGAGGGSVVWVDEGGLLRVGPQSAGAEPGPAAYGRGGTAPTVTDCHVVRGTIRPAAFLGGRMLLDHTAAAAALAPVAARLGLDLVGAADAAIQVAEGNIVRAVQRISTERGHDPRDFCLVPFGGAGPMLACRVAEDLGIGEVLVPPAAGVLSAYGLLAADYVHHESRTFRLLLDADGAARARDMLAELANLAAAHLHDLGLTGPVSTAYSLDMRYLGQAFEVGVELPAAELAELDHGRILASFERAHHRIFEFDKAGGAAVEIVACRVRAAVAPASVPWLTTEPAAGYAETPITLLERGRRRTATARSRPGPGERVHGPALIEDGTSTLLVAEGWSGLVDESHNLVLSRAETGP